MVELMRQIAGILFIYNNQGYVNEWPNGYKLLFRRLQHSF